MQGLEADFNPKPTSEERAINGVMQRSWASPDGLGYLWIKGEDPENAESASCWRIISAGEPLLYPRAERILNRFISNAVPGWKDGAVFIERSLDNFGHGGKKTHAQIGNKSIDLAFVPDMGFLELIVKRTDYLSSAPPQADHRR